MDPNTQPTIPNVITLLKLCQACWTDINTTRTTYLSASEREALDWLERNDLITRTSSDQYEATERGKVMIKHLLKQPLPSRTWTCQAVA
jgi:hypothetical protein